VNCFTPLNRLLRHAGGRPGNGRAETFAMPLHPPGHRRV
jgi:hypothetical protein